MAIKWNHFTFPTWKAVAADAKKVATIVETEAKKIETGVVSEATTLVADVEHKPAATSVAAPVAAQPK